MDSKLALQLLCISIAVATVLSRPEHEVKRARKVVVQNERRADQYGERRADQYGDQYGEQRADQYGERRADQYGAKELLDRLKDEGWDGVEPIWKRGENSLLEYSRMIINRSTACYLLQTSLN